MGKMNKKGIITLSVVGALLLCGAGTTTGYFVAKNQYDKKVEQYKGYLKNTAYDYLSAALAYQLSGETKGMIKQSYAVATYNISQLIEKANDETNTEYYYVNVNGKNKLMHNGLPVSIISDIDDTLVDGARYSCNILGNDGDSNNAAFARFLQSENCLALDGAVEFTNYCANNGVEVFYVTNRYDQAYKVGQKDSYSSYEESIKKDGEGKYVDKNGNLIGSTVYQLYGKSMYDISYESMSNLGFPIDYDHFFMNDLVINGSSKEYMRKSIREGNTSLYNGQRSDGCSITDAPTTVNVTAHDVVMYLGDNLGDFSDVFANAENSIKRSELVSEYSSKWGKEWIVFPNAVYGDWLKSAMKYTFDQLFKELDYLN